MDLPRSSGVLLHISSLPGRFGIGDLGPEAFAFADFLAEARQYVWQILPIVPIGFGYSPYASTSTFAGNPLFISPEVLVDQNLLTDDHLQDLPAFPTDRVDFEQVIPFKTKLLEAAYGRFEQGSSAIAQEEFDQFCQQQAAWLDDYSLFEVLKSVHNGTVWTEWPAPLRKREPAALKKAKANHQREIEQQKFWQFLFFNQWNALHAYCQKRNVTILGDLPIYVAHDSADVWSNPDLFFLDDDGHQLVVAGVPPDYFAATGQRWGNPIYRWDRMKENGYQWWTARMRAILEQVDIIRLDHFRGFDAFWEVPASEETAVNGRWVEGPRHDLFNVMEAVLGALPVIAEDLGFITEGVVELMQAFRYPGMAILQFAFDTDPADSFLPHNYKPDLVAYTGTHDNDTVWGWYTNNSSTRDETVIEAGRQYCREYLGIEKANENDLHWAFTRALMSSVANLIVVPLQDLVGLSSEGRMNIPGTLGGANWAWRATKDMLDPAIQDRLGSLTRTYGRQVKANSEG